MHAIWNQSFSANSGNEFEAVESAKACTIGSNVYMFGGFARQIFNSLKVLNTKTRKMQLVWPPLGKGALGQDPSQTPPARQ